MTGHGKGRSAGGPPVEASHRGSPRSARHGLRRFELSEDSEDSSVDWEVLQGLEESSAAASDHESSDPSPQSSSSQGVKPAVPLRREPQPYSQVGLGSEDLRRVVVRELAVPPKSKLTRGNGCSLTSRIEFFITVYLWRSGATASGS